MDDYRVFVVPQPVDAAGRPVDIEHDKRAHRVLHERIDALDEKRLLACALAADAGGLEMPKRALAAEWARKQLHEGVDLVFGDYYHRFQAIIHLDGERLVVSGEGVYALTSDETYAWVAALGESRITDEPLPGTKYKVESLESSHCVEPVDVWFAGHVQEALAATGVSLSSKSATRLLDILKYRSAGEPSVAAIAKAEAS